MSVRRKHGRWIVEVYDPALGRKRHVTQREMRDFGFAPPTSERQAKRVEREILSARDRRRPGTVAETVASFAARWSDDYRRGKGGRARSDQTVSHNRERVSSFGRAHGTLSLRDVDRALARSWAAAHPGQVPALRAMFSDALEDRLVDENPFAKLGLTQRRGRADIVVLTVAEVDELARIALEHHGEIHGPEVAATIVWAAYTGMRPGETFAARYSRLKGDVYDVGRQFNSVLRREAPPKHGGVGEIYVPERARRAVLEKPRRLGDDLMFHSKRGKQLRQESWHRAWDPVRRAFTAALPGDHDLRRRVATDPDDLLHFHELRHFGASFLLNELELEPWVIAEQLRHHDGGALVVQLYGHPSRRKAIEIIRRAHTGGTVRPITGGTGEAKGTSTAGGKP